MAGWRASFAPKTAPDAVGNGVHIHFSFRDRGRHAGDHDPDRPGGLCRPSPAPFCAGRARATCRRYVALTAPSVPSYLRLQAA